MTSEQKSSLQQLMKTDEHVRISGLKPEGMLDVAIGKDDDDCDFHRIHPDGSSVWTAVRGGWQTGTGFLEPVASL